MYAVQLIGNVVSFLIILNDDHNFINYFNFILATDKDSVVEGNNSKTEADNSDLICVFGKLKIKVGDRLNTDGTNLVCTCQTPPHLHCEDTST